MKTKLIVGLIIIIIAVLLSWHFIFPSSVPAGAPQMQPAPLTIDPSTLPGIQTGDAPWPPELDSLRTRLSMIGLAALPQEGTALHIHQHLDISVNGQPVAVPPGIGINEAAGYISPIHVHDASGIIHVESPVVRDFTLGEFFDIWGVRFTATCLGGYCADASSTLAVYVDGMKLTTDPRDLVLASHQEIAIVFGSASATPATIPSSYVFPAGY